MQSSWAGVAILFLGLSLQASAQQSALTAEATKTPPPDALQAPIKEVLNSEPILIKNADGKPFLTLWVRKAVPASAKPAGAKGTIQFPFLQPGELIGAIEFAAEGQDYRDQIIDPGVYTLRYGLQPVNGDHLGVSKDRDYLLLVPAKDDATVAMIPQKTLEKHSTDASGTNHPAVLILLAAPKDAKPAQTVHDEEHDLWGVVMTVPLKVEGETAAEQFSAQLIVRGAAMP
jgi:hypothetical protein